MKVLLKYCLLGEITVEMTRAQFEELHDQHGFPIDEDDLTATVGIEIDSVVLSDGIYEVEFTDAHDIGPKKPKKPSKAKRK